MGYYSELPLKSSSLLDAGIFHTFDTYWAQALGSPHKYQKPDCFGFFRIDSIELATQKSRGFLEKGADTFPAPRVVVGPLPGCRRFEYQGLSHSFPRPRFHEFCLGLLNETLRHSAP